MGAPSTFQARESGHIWRGKHGRQLRWAAVAIPIAIVAILLIGFSDIVPVSLSGYATTTGTNCVYCPASIIGVEHLPPNEKATVTWVDTDGGLVIFSVGGPQGMVLREVGNSGSGGFQTNGGGNYYFVAVDAASQSSQHVNYTVAYDAPIF